MSLKPKPKKTVKSKSKKKTTKKSSKGKKRVPVMFNMDQMKFLREYININNVPTLTKALMDLGVENVTYVEHVDGMPYATVKIGVDRYVSEGQLWYYAGGHAAADDATHTLEQEIWNGADSLHSNIVLESLRSYPIREQNEIFENMKDGYLRDDVVRRMARDIVNYYGFEKVLEGDSEIWKRGHDKMTLKKLNGKGYLLKIG